MKFLPFLSAVLFTVFLATPLQAGETSPLLKKFQSSEVSFDIKEAPIQIAFMYVSSLADVPINTDQVTRHQRVAFACEDMSAHQAVSRLCKMTGLSYEITPDEIVIKPAKLAGGAPAAPTE